MPKMNFGEQVSRVPLKHRLTEAGGAERFAAEHAKDLRFIHPRDQWVIFRGHRWAPDTSGGVVRLARADVRRWQHEALDLPGRISPG